MKLDHEAAKKWAEDVWDTLKDTALHEVLEADAIDHRNTAACYLDAMTRLDKAEKECGDLLGRARDMLCDGWTEIEMAAWLADYRAFIER